MFVLGKPSQPCLMFASKARSLPLSWALESALIGWKGLPGTNTLAYYENYDRKKFYRVGPWSYNIQFLELNSKTLGPKSC